MVKRILILAVITVISISAASTSEAFHGCRVAMGFAPSPRLVSPSSDKVQLTGKSDMEFVWSPHEGDRLQRRYYDFRLYKGYDMLEATLIFKERVSAGKHQLAVKTDLFKNGEVYTWSLRQVYRDSSKSRRSIRSFRVLK
jgi:hypothetical protein